MAALLTAAAVAGFMLWEPDRPDLRLFYQVKNGMTEAEVVAVFGTRPTAEKPWQIADRPPWRQPGTPKYWYCDAAIVTVYFDANGRTVLCIYSGYGNREHPTQTKLRKVYRSVENLLGL